MTNKSIRDYINLIENAQKEDQLNEFAPDGFGGDDGEEFDPAIAKMAQEDGFIKGVVLVDGATLERAMAIEYWHSRNGGLYKQYFAKGFKKGRMNKINHDNKQYGLDLFLKSDGSVGRGKQQGVAEGSEKHECGHCHGTGRMVRDPDIGTDQECFVCDGTGYVTDEQLDETSPEAIDKVNQLYRN
jgi:hypothetical protein